MIQISMLLHASPHRTLRRVVLKHLLAACVALSAGAIPAGAANQISERAILLDQPITGDEIARITALKDWPWVEASVERSGDDATLAALRDLRGLRRLKIRGGAGRITTLQPLADLGSLLTLDVGQIQLSTKEPISLAPLAGCPELLTLKIVATRLTDVAAIGQCPNLRVLDLDACEVDSLDFLKSTPRIERLRLLGANHAFPSYEPISRLPRLRELGISLNPQATDQNLAVLKRLTGLQEISVFSCREITSLDFLSGNAGLRVINASGCHSLADITALARLSFLEEVDLARAKITDIAPLAGKDYLIKVDLAHTAVTDLTPLAGSRHLRSLTLSRSEVTDLSVLSGIRKLSHLNLSGTRVVDISPLKDCLHLHNLSLAGTAVTDLSALAGLTELRLLNLTGTQIADFTPLHGLVELDQITLPAQVDEERIAQLRTHLPGTKIVVR